MTRILAGFKDDLAVMFEYGSRNSEAHLTIMEFYIDESDLPRLTRYMEAFASELDDVKARFDHFDSFPAKGGNYNGTVFIAPDNISSDILSARMRSFVKGCTVRHKSIFKFKSAPHVTIGRRLSQDNVLAGCALFGRRLLEIETNFTLVLRVRDENLNEQFQAVSEFPFTGNCRNIETDQLRLDL